MSYQLLHLIYTFMHHLMELLEPIAVPLCFVTAWTIVILVGLNLFAAVRAGVDNAQQMHRIPCANCRYFTSEYQLKCPVRPTAALSEAAINCPDFERSPSD